MSSVKCIFNGRIGNQLFQLAHVLGKSMEHGVPVVLGDWPIVDYFPICKTLAVHPTVHKVTHYERGFHYNNYPVTPGVCNEYSGYFQTEKYFSKYRKFIVAMLTPNVDIKMPDGVWCAIHVRRGDYVNLQDCHPVQTLEYYKSAIERVGKVNGYIIFSDDITWCKENISPLCDGVVKYEDEFATHPVEVLWCMAQCKNIIGSNSSFSWWAAYLGDQEGIKIFPKVWFGPALTCHDIKDITPETWIRM